MKPGLTVFESHMGKQYSDSPRYIYEAAVAAGLDQIGIDPVWSYARKRQGFPSDVRLVKRGSWRYHLDLARAEFWVDNQGFPRAFARRRETTYVQTWHGTPMKRMGFDSPALERAGAGVRRQHKAMIKRWSALLVPSEYFVETFVKSYALPRSAGAQGPAAQRPARPRCGRLLGEGQEGRAGTADRSHGWCCTARPSATGPGGSRRRTSCRWTSSRCAAPWATTCT